MTTSSDPNNSEIITSGGTYAGGGVNAGNDFIGRDQINNYSTTYNVTYPPEAAVPNQLERRRTQHFVGRDQPIDWIKDNLKPGATLVVIGPGGMGKTTLSIQAINEMAQDDGKLYELFPDGIIFHTFYGRPEVDLCFANILAAYGVEPKGDVEQLTRQTLGSKRPLLILDGCEDVKEQEGLRRVLDVVGNSGVLITTRAKSHGRLGTELDLERLEPNEAIGLLKTVAGKDYDLPDEIGAEICERVDRLPLGVDIAGNYLRETGEPAADYLAWLKEAPVEALDHGETRRESMYYIVRRSAERIDDVGKDILVVLGQMAFLPVPVWAVAELLEWKPRQLNLYLREMVRYGLIKFEGGELVCTHALVHGYARDKHMGEQWSQEAMLMRLFEWTEASYKAWQKETPPNFANCDALRPHGMLLLERLEEQEKWGEANRLVWAFGPGDGYLKLQGHFVENTLALETGIRVCQRLGDKRDENSHLMHLALVYQNTGQVEKSVELLERGLEISREMKDRQNEGNQLGNLGLAYSNLGRVEGAIEMHEQALMIAREIGDRRGEGKSLGNLGLAYRNLGRVEEAIEQYEQALVIAREIGDRQGEGYQLGNLGNAYSDLGRVEEGIEQYKQALVIAREIGDRRGEGAHLGNLGIAYADLEQYDKALDYYEEAAAISQEIGNISTYANQLVNMGLVYENNLDPPDPQKAKALWQEALAIYEKIGSPHAETVRGWLNDL